MHQKRFPNQIIIASCLSACALVGSGCTSDDARDANRGANTSAAKTHDQVSDGRRVAAQKDTIYTQAGLTVDAEDDGVSARAKHEKSADCRSPNGKEINISWGDGNVTTTVYFNNHCNEKRAIDLEFVKQDGVEHHECFTVNGKTSGQKRVNYGSAKNVKLRFVC